MAAVIVAAVCAGCTLTPEYHRSAMPVAMQWPVKEAHTGSPVATVSLGV
ncbi:RND efflux system, outer membrane lipoprotei CmeC [Dickeya dianthicola RNS04.9]|nr:RND efflux system, outer membrane lipoprotei CmeC [Dickeya dianthicola RNS04.9]